MSNDEADKKSDADQGHKKGHGSGHAGGIGSLLTVGVEILLMLEISSSHWHAWWMKCLLVGFVVTVFWFVYKNARLWLKCTAFTAFYSSLIVSVIVSAALLASYLGLEPLHAHRQAAIYS